MNHIPSVYFPGKYIVFSAAVMSEQKCCGFDKCKLVYDLFLTIILDLTVDLVFGNFASMIFAFTGFLYWVSHLILICQQKEPSWVCPNPVIFLFCSWVTLLVLTEICLLTDLSVFFFVLLGMLTIVAAIVQCCFFKNTKNEEEKGCLCGMFSCNCC